MGSMDVIVGSEIIEKVKSAVMTLTPDFGILFYNNDQYDTYMESFKMREKDGSYEAFQYKPVTVALLKELNVQTRSLAKEYKVATGLYGRIPENLLFINAMNKKEMMWYNPPQERLVMFDAKKKVKIMAPWTLYYSSNDSPAVFALKQKPQDKSVLYEMPLPNVGGHGGWCKGNTRVLANSSNIQEWMQILEHRFWGTYFTNENSEKFAQVYKQYNPDLTLLKKAKKTLKELIDDEALHNY